MLERPGPRVVVFLERAILARERAQRARDAETHEFHERMEASWLRMAASAAFIERVERFLRARDEAVPATDRCPECARLMMLRTIETRDEAHVYSFRCTFCGASETRVARL